MHPLRHIAEAQVDRARQVRDRTTTELQLLLHRALKPDHVRKAMLKERPVLEAVRKLDLQGPDPADLRIEALAVEALEGTMDDLDYRRLFPALDLGVYCANHAVGKPSEPARLAMDQFYAQHAVFGIDAFVEAGWIDLIDDTRALVGDLCGDTGLQRGTVTFFPNLSDALSASLAGLKGRLVTTAGHFTTGHYIHAHWAARTGSEVVIVEQDEQECISTASVIEALTPDTAVVSLSQVHWRSGYVHDIEAISEAMAAVCPDAVLLFDVYQGQGTVPVDCSVLPPRTAILGGGLKQLHAGAGAGYGWFSHAFTRDHVPDHTGWWAHAEPLAFEQGFRMGEGATRLQTGTPALLPIILLGTELKVLAASGADGTVQAGVARARERTRDLIEGAVHRAHQLGLTTRGPRDPERRGAFFAIEVDDGPGVLEALAAAGVTADFRADEPGGESGIVRMSASPAHYTYEMVYAVDALAAIVR